MSQGSTPIDPLMDDAALRGQQAHWTHTFAAHPDMYGQAPSAPARAAVPLFQAEGVTTLLELGAGQGRDALFFARRVRGADRKSTRLNSSHPSLSRMPSSA